MYSKQQRDLLRAFKALADETRLTMIALMSEKERTVSEMSALLKLTEPTISHHVAKLQSIGLLSLRMAGNQRFYQVNQGEIAKFKSNVDALGTPLIEEAKEPSDNAWIDTLNWDEADKKVLRAHTFNGQLTQFPSKDKKWMVILRWLATLFEQDKQYSEKEMNAILTEVNEDYATLRRDLVEFGFMRRERGGGNYWLTPEDETMPTL